MQYIKCTRLLVFFLKQKSYLISRYITCFNQKLFIAQLRFMYTLVKSTFRKWSKYSYKNFPTWTLSVMRSDKQNLYTCGYELCTVSIKRAEQKYVLLYVHSRNFKQPNAALGKRTSIKSRFADCNFWFDPHSLSAYMYDRWLKNKGPLRATPIVTFAVSFTLWHSRQANIA